MVKPNQKISRVQAKRNVVFDAASEVFALYGYKRTTMQDIAQAVGFSRPALYLLFDNKETLFRELTDYRLNKALDATKTKLAEKEELKIRIIHALLIFESIFYEPVSKSPHGAELMDINQSLASDVMAKGFLNLVTSFAAELKTAEKNKKVSFKDTVLTPKSFFELLLTALIGIKKKAKNRADFRKQTELVAGIFLDSIAIKGKYI